MILGVQPSRPEATSFPPSVYLSSLNPPVDSLARSMGRAAEPAPLLPNHFDANVVKQLALNVHTDISCTTEISVHAEFSR